MKLKLTCKEATLLIIKEKGQLTFSEFIKMKLHLFICKYCTLFLKQNKILNQELGKALTLKNNDSLSSDEKQKMKDKLKEEN